MGPVQRVYGAVALAASVGLMAASPAVAVTTAERAGAATHFIAVEQLDDGSFTSFSGPGAAADAVLALVAARRGERQIDRAIGYLRSKLRTLSYGQRAKTVLALVAAGRNPRSFFRRNLVAQVRAVRSVEGQFGAPDGIAEVTDHVLAVLALAAARSPIPRSAIEWLALAQCPDGGWQFDEPHRATEDERCFDPAPDSGDYDASNVDTTAYAVMALNARPSTVPLRADPIRYLDLARDPIKRGWAYDPAFLCDEIGSSTPCSLTSANSTALAIQAYAAEGERLPAGAMAALHGLQYPLCGRKGGAFAIAYDPATGERPAPRTPFLGRDVGATIGAVPALVRKPFPLAPFRVQRAVTRLAAC